MERRTSSRTGTSPARKTRSAEPASDDLIGPNDIQRLEVQEPQSTGILNTMKERATTQLATQKDRATEGLGTLAQAVRDTTERLRDEQHDTVAAYVERAAEQLERLSTNLRSKDVNELLQDAQRLARRRPALFIGGGFAVGLLAARFLKSSRRSATQDYAWPDSSTDADTQVPDLQGGY